MINRNHQEVLGIHGDHQESAPQFYPPILPLSVCPSVRRRGRELAGSHWLAEHPPNMKNFLAELLLGRLGGSRFRHKQDAHKAARKIVSEILKLIRDRRHRHIVPGFAFDITVDDPDYGNPWDQSVASLAPNHVSRSRTCLSDRP